MASNTKKLSEKQELKSFMIIKYVYLLTSNLYKEILNT